MAPRPRTDLPNIAFRSQAAWERWLEKHHLTSPGIWMKLAKKDSGIPSLNYQEALDVALCFGWIDGLKSALDEQYWMQRFTPRKPRSKWSKINCGKIATLEKAGKLRPAGLREVESARKDGRWEAAYAGQRTMEVPADLAALLKKNARARAAFEALPGYRRYSVLYWLHDAKKPETRERRMARVLESLTAGKDVRALG